jgi:transcriptional regulator with XRE-family HTH domain
MDLREVFATNLRRLRNAKGLAQDDLAYEAEVSRSYLSQLEKGAFYASLKIVGKLAEALEVEPAELLKLPDRRSKSRECRFRRSRPGVPI